MRSRIDEGEGHAHDTGSARGKSRLPAACPVCGERLSVRELHCESCHTQIRGLFESPCAALSSLPAKDLEFVELFVRARGNIKEMEKALGLSYPTVRGILDGVIERLEDHGDTKTRPSETRRASILSRLESGEIDAATAAKLLRGDIDAEPDGAGT
jgi:hypothetical protein